MCCNISWDMWPSLDCHYHCVDLTAFAKQWSTQTLTQIKIESETGGHPSITLSYGDRQKPLQSKNINSSQKACCCRLGWGGGVVVCNINTCNEIELDHTFSINSMCWIYSQSFWWNLCECNEYLTKEKLLSKETFLAPSTSGQYM